MTRKVKCPECDFSYDTLLEGAAERWVMQHWYFLHAKRRNKRAKKRTCFCCQESVEMDEFMEHCERLGGFLLAYNDTANGVTR